MTRAYTRLEAPSGFTTVSTSLPDAAALARLALVATEPLGASLDAPRVLRVRVARAGRVAGAGSGSFSAFSSSAPELVLVVDSTDARGAEFHTYHIEVAVEVDGSGDGAGEGELQTRTLHLDRRFSDFSAVDGALRARLPPTALSRLPALPSSLIFNKLSDSVVSARRAGLDKYVGALLADGQLAEQPEVLRFFAADPLPNVAEREDEMVQSAVLMPRVA